jgi:hypothetical protein
MLNSGSRGSEGITIVGIGRAIRGSAKLQLKTQEPVPSTGVSGLTSGPGP